MQMIQPVQQQNYYVVNGRLQAMVAQQEMIDYTVSPSNIVPFHGRHYLSTLAHSPMNIDDFNYPSVEHYYQACKLYTLAGGDSAWRMSSVTDSAQCKITARSVLNLAKIPPKTVDAWRRTDAPEILVFGNAYKFAQNRELRDRLLDTGDALLVHTFEKDDLYAVGMNEESTKKWALDKKGKHIQVPRYFLKDWFVQSNKLPTYNVRGKNILGVILMMIREAFRPERGRADPKIVEVLEMARGRLF